MSILLADFSELELRTTAATIFCRNEYEVNLHFGDGTVAMPARQLAKRRMEGKRMHDMWLRAEIVKRDTSPRNTFSIQLPALFPKAIEVNLK
jgi:hypothetical protein